MSTALRIASVTQVLKDLLDNGLIDHDVTGGLGGNVIVTAWPPDKIETALNKEASQLNLFMYHITYNQGWRNVGQPAFNQGGQRINNPPLAIDLHYLLTAYGSAELHTEILLGYGMQLFHETPVLARDAIRKAIGPPTLMASGTTVTNLPDSLKLLSSSDLAEQAEQISISPEVLSIEDISKLWAAFGAKYRPSAAYRITVILIESSRSTKPGLPVKGRNIYVQPFRQPLIEQLLSQSAAGQPAIENQKILNGFRLVLQGKRLMHEPVKVTIDGVEVNNVTANLAASDAEVSFDLPAGLNAGIHEVQVNHPAMIGSPPFEHTGIVSKSQPFVLSPTIVGNPVVSAPGGSGTEPRSATIQVTVDPAINPGQKVILLLNEQTNAADASSYSFPVPASFFLSPPQPATDISVRITGVKKATYLVRIQVDGAESPLGSDAAGKYNSPVFSL